MAIIQSSQSGLRYLKRQQLEEEARIIGNYYRDIINSYGIDVNYYKLDTSIFENYKGIIDQNILLQKAYGYNISPDYSISAEMISYMEVEQDIFQLNKIGLNPDATVNFYFESTDFACALAEKLGQYKEYKIYGKTLSCEVPDILDTDKFPYKLKLGKAEKYTCDVLSGCINATIEKYEFDKEQTIVCQPKTFTIFERIFDANKDLYKTFKYWYENTDNLKTLIYLTFKVSKITENNIEKCILTGNIHGSVLFYDIYLLTKYITKIHPEVGDIITIDFPNEQNREQYEITDAFDKSLQTDGISPLLHKYIWKCKARRYINSYENVEINESNEQLEEKLKFDQVVDSEIVEKISKYDDNQDAVYGGYSHTIEKYDKESVDTSKCYKFDYIEDGTALDIITFGCKSKLVTTGYELLFIDIDGNAYQLTTLDKTLPVNDAYAEHKLKYIKANKSSLVFVNILGEAYRIVTDEEYNQFALELHLDNLFEKSFDQKQINKNGDNFYKFNNCKTYLFATPHHLFCHLESTKTLYKLI